MSLPIRTTVEDIETLCAYLITKPTGARLAEAKAVVDKKFFDGRKLHALKSWGLLEEDSGKLKITEDAVAGQLRLLVLHVVRPCEKSSKT